MAQFLKLKKRFKKICQILKQFNEHLLFVFGRLVVILHSSRALKQYRLMELYIFKCVNCIVENRNEKMSVFVIYLIQIAKTQIFDINIFVNSMF